MAAEKKDNGLWEKFAGDFKLSVTQVEQCKRYAALLRAWNEKFNLTAITSLPGIIYSHFYDSLALRDALDLNSVHALVDVGSGAGFPGIPIKIAYPSVHVILIEVNAKKRSFLQAVIEELGLAGIEVCELDFRTFVRTTEGQIDLFVARASLEPVELTRIFSPVSSYTTATLVYWAAHDWQVPEKISHLLQAEVPYKIKQKKRKLVLFKK